MEEESKKKKKENQFGYEVGLGSTGGLRGYDYSFPVSLVSVVCEKSHNLSCLL